MPHAVAEDPKPVTAGMVSIITLNQWNNLRYNYSFLNTSIDE
jgi:hypothetical protein